MRTPADMPKPGKIVEAYSYQDANGRELYQSVRMEPKDFRPRRRVNGKWQWDLQGVERVLYRLPEIINSQEVFICEGEKDVHTLESLGLVATTSIGGAGGWQNHYAETLRGKIVIVCGDNDEPGKKYAQAVIDSVLPVASEVGRLRVPEPYKDVSDFVAAVGAVQAKTKLAEILDATPSEQSPGDALSALLEAHRFDLNAPPPRTRAIYHLGKAQISTQGNLTVIAAQAKVGKSALVGAFIASAITSTEDTLEIFSSNPNGHALIHFDTEQSRADHHSIVSTALRRAATQNQPAWLRSYSMVDVPLQDRLRLLEHELDRAQRDHGGIHSVLLDGIADFTLDPNDPEASFSLVEKLHRLAVVYDTNIVCVLHFNPGGDFKKTRGHLGSQLERKAETNLALEKIDSVTVVYTKMARHAHVEKNAGPRFTWDGEAQMHVSCETLRGEKAEADDFHLREITDEIFTGKSALRYSELIQEIMLIKKVKTAQAERTIKKLVPLFVKKLPSGKYEKA